MKKVDFNDFVILAGILFLLYQIFIAQTPTKRETLENIRDKQYEQTEIDKAYLDYIFGSRPTNK